MAVKKTQKVGANIHWTLSCVKYHTYLMIDDVLVLITVSWPGEETGLRVKHSFAHLRLALVKP